MYDQLLLFLNLWHLRPLGPYVPDTQTSFSYQNSYISSKQKLYKFTETKITKLPWYSKMYIRGKPCLLNTDDM